MRGGWMVVGLLVGCSASPVPDAGGSDASAPFDAGWMTDAGRADAGQADAGDWTDSGIDSGAIVDAGADRVFLEFTADDQRVHLFWDAGTLVATGWVVTRDAVQVALLGSSARDFEDTTAMAGSLSGFDASATRAMPQGIEVEWTVPSAQPGPESTYQVRALTADASIESNETRARRSPPTLLGFTVERGDGGWSFTALETFWLDTSAPLPGASVTALQAQATPNDQTSSVVLRATASVVRTPVPLTYVVRAQASAGAEPQVQVQGERGGNRVEFQWQRSLDDSPDAFIDLPYVHGLLWLDPEAVLGEGRYYRVVGRAAGQESPSSPVRAELRSPRVLAGDHSTRFLLRDDGLAIALTNSMIPPTQFPPVSDFVVADGAPCGLLADAGVVCALPGGGLAPRALPPARSITGGRFLCVATSDAGALCPGSPFDLTDIERVLDVSRNLLCGLRFDGGVRCVSNGGTAAAFDIVPAPLALWIDVQWQQVTASYPGGQTVSQGQWATALTPPMEDAGYLSGGSVVGANCGLRPDGRLRCTTVVSPWAASPSVSAETYGNVDMGDDRSLCGLTTGRRVRCFAPGLVPVVPPQPPVRDVTVEHAGAVALLENGGLDARGISARALPQSLDDRFSQLPRGWSRECALRTDGTALCGVPATDQYVKITQRFGLLTDGGIRSWGGSAPWPQPGPFTDLQEAWLSTCARFPDGGWTCDAPGSIPQIDFAMIAHNGREGCGLTRRGRLICWPDDPPAALSSYRFRHLSWGQAACVTTLEGEVFCLSSLSNPGPFAPLPWDDFLTFEQSTAQGCGIRRDHTMGCRPGLPESPPW